MEFQMSHRIQGEGGLKEATWIGAAALKECYGWKFSFLLQQFFPSQKQSPQIAFTLSRDKSNHMGYAPFQGFKQPCGRNFQSGS